MNAGLLLGAAKEKPFQHLGGFDPLAVGRLDVGGEAVDVVDDAAFFWQAAAVLVVIGQLHGWPPTSAAAVWGCFASQHIQKATFAGPVWPNHADAVASIELKIEVFEQDFGAVLLAQVAGFEDAATETAAGEGQGDAFVGSVVLDLAQLFDALFARFLFGAAG